MTAERKPVFFTSVPKCGKNLVYSFYFGLGLRRWNWGDAPAILHAAHFARVSDKQNYAFPEVGRVDEKRERDVLGHLIAQLSTMPSDVIAHHHFLPAPRLLQHIADSGLNTVFVMRDPRDALVSMLNYAKKWRLPQHVSVAIGEMSDEDALLLLIEGRDKLVPFAMYFDAYRPWLTASGVTVLRFEDLVGPRGGGDATRQQEACATLATLAGLPPDDNVRAATDRVFNKESGTFFKGQIGAWREAFTPSVARAYERLAGWLMPKWGYDGDAGVE